MNQIGILDQPEHEIIKRPTAITMICILGFIGVALSVPMIFSEIAWQIGSWFPPYAGFSTVVSLICMIGLWRNKKWALYSFSTLVLINQVVLITKGEWNVLILIVQGIIILIALYHLHPNSKPVFHQIILWLKRKTWAITVAYMVGVHNFYREEQKDSEEIVYTIDNIEEQESGESED
jgi:hypothetical protein